MMKNLLISFVILFGFPGTIFSQQALEHPYTLWYDRPANVWTEALPVGNGSLGGMVFGGISREHIQLNEETVWTRGGEYQIVPDADKYIPEVRKLLFAGKYAEAEKMAAEHIMTPRLPSGTNTYQTLGDLNILLSHNPEKVRNYKRTLDLSSGIAEVTYDLEGVQYTRTVFSSYPDKVMVIHLRASLPEKISAHISLSRPGDKANVYTRDDYLFMQQNIGDSGGVKMFTMARILCPNGTMTPVTGVQSAPSGLKTGFDITAADEILIILTAATDYRGDNPETICQNRILKIADKSYSQLLATHTEDFKSLSERMDLQIGTSSKDSLPVDVRLKEFRTNPDEDLALVSLYFQFGRYLLISSSRPGSLPANLQGLWCNSLAPPWNADYHININLQMNYWPAEVTQLRECHMPLFDFVDSLLVHGQKTAGELYHARGAVAHHVTDVWFPTTCIGRPVWGLWPFGLAWLSRQYWDYYLFTGDKTFLEKRAYPVLRDASLFFTDYLTTDPRSGKYVSGPSTSPENTFIAPDGNKASINMGNAMDQEIIHELFTNTISAARELRKDKKWTKTLQGYLENLKYPEIGADGRILEWGKPFEEAEPGHRHVSHLFGLHPGTMFTWSSAPAYMQAAEKTLTYRLNHGGGHTGWSRAWIINFYARLLDGESAWNHVVALLSKSTLPNLFDTHPPFQIDGNFGGTAGIAEMLIQSHMDTICLFPAVPRAWKSGYLKGIVARDGFIFNIRWNDEYIQEITVYSSQGKVCKLRYMDHSVAFPTEKGKTYHLNGDLNPFSVPENNPFETGSLNQ